MNGVEVRQDRVRGCGWRKEGGLYLVADGFFAQCGKLPIPLTVCPTCHAGIKPSRGWTWIDGDALVAQEPCALAPCTECRLAKPMGRVGLLWIGEQFYPTPAHWKQESRTQGISRRLSGVPKDFKIGETWVFVAHRKVIPNEGGKHTPGVFQAFKPTAIEYVVKESDTQEKIDALIKRGITPVRIERIEETRELSLQQ